MKDALCETKNTLDWRVPPPRGHKHPCTLTHALQGLALKTRFTRQVLAWQMRFVRQKTCTYAAAPVTSTPPAICSSSRPPPPLLSCQHVSKAPARRCQRAGAAPLHHDATIQDHHLVQGQHALQPAGGNASSGVRLISGGEGHTHWRLELLRCLGGARTRGGGGRGTSTGSLCMQLLSGWGGAHTRPGSNANHD